VTLKPGDSSPIIGGFITAVNSCAAAALDLEDAI
jgi:hypothetical protein